MLEKALDISIKLSLIVVLVLGSTLLLNTLNIHPLGKDYNHTINAIEPNQKMDRLSNILRTATSKDTVTIHVTSHGGHIATMSQLINDIRHSKAHVTTIASGAAMSAGALLSFAGDSVKVRSGTIFMFHLSRNMMGVSPLSTVPQRRFIELLMQHGGNYLTDKELMRVFTGKDVYITDFHHRILKPGKKRTGEQVSKLVRRAQIINQAARVAEAKRLERVKRRTPKLRSPMGR